MKNFYPARFKIILLFLIFMGPGGFVSANNSISHSLGKETFITPQEHQGSEEKHLSKGKVKAEWDEFPSLHPLVVHFPVVLLGLAALLQLIQLFILKKNMDWVILLVIGGGFIGAFIAAKVLHPDPQGLSEMAKKVFEHHDTYAMWTLWISAAAAATLKIFSLFIKKYKRAFEIFLFIVMLGSGYTVSMAGHYGSQLVYIEGVGPQGDHLKPHHEH